MIRCYEVNHLSHVSAVTMVQIHSARPAERHTALYFASIIDSRRIIGALVFRDYSSWRYATWTRIAFKLNISRLRRRRRRLRQQPGRTRATQAQCATAMIKSALGICRTVRRKLIAQNVAAAAAAAGCSWR